MTFSRIVTALIGFSLLTTLISASLTQEPNSTVSAPTATRSSSDTNAVACVTGGGDFHMDPAVAQGLSAHFCTQLAQPYNFPQPGVRSSGAGYPTDLGNTKRSLMRRGEQISEFASAPGVMNMTLVEIDGGITEFSFSRGYTSVINSVLHVSGTDQQCGRDNCTEGFRHAINRCQFNTHHIGGMAMYLTDCGLYTVMVQNCSGNYVDRDCRRWHARWPEVGLKENETLFWNITHNIWPTVTAATTETAAVGSKVVAGQLAEEVDMRGLSDRLDRVIEGLNEGLFWVEGRN